MIKNDKVQIRISEELLDYCKDNSENLSRFIRDAMREKIESKSAKDNSISLVEIRARTPFTFFAELDHVVDGDTLVLIVDLGFFIKHNIKVRLAAIDTPPITTDKGRKAKEFVERELKGSNLIIETRKKGKYGRFLTFIYYHNEYEDFDDIIRHGKMINDELVKNGLAVKY